MIEIRVHEGGHTRVRFLNYRHSSLSLLPNLFNYVFSLGDHNIPNAGGSAAQIDQFKNVGVGLEYDLILILSVFVNLLR